MRDVPRSISIGLPAITMMAFLVMAIASPAFYRGQVRKHEVGWQEQGTVLCLVPAVGIGAMLLVRYRMPALLRIWVAILASGALYFAGEECSWGQNYFGWSTPESWSRINDQHETNLHNTSGLFDHTPRAILSIAAGCSLVLPWLKGRRQWGQRGNSLLALFLPTRAVAPAAALALCVGIPQKLHGHYEKTREATSWFAEMFLAGRHSELKEFYLAMFILMYVWSLAVRYHSAQAMGGECHRAGELTDRAGWKLAG